MPRSGWDGRYGAARMTDHPDSLTPIHRPPWALTPPYDSRDPRLFRRRGESMEQAHNRIAAIKTAALLEPLEGLTVTDYECRVLGWVACWETHTVAVLAALLRRARYLPADLGNATNCNHNCNQLDRD